MRALALWIAVVAAGCGGGAVEAPRASSPRADVTARLCELLPARADECVVSWPASLSSRRRAEVMSASVAGPLAGSDSPVRAYASCRDRPLGAERVARISVLLLARTPESREALEAALPLSFRWEGEPCEADTCALPVATLDGDRVVLRQRDFDPEERAPDVASRACSAVRTGAVEAHATADASVLVVRELHADDAGVDVVVRGRDAEPSHERIGWSELGLRLRDQEILREAAARTAESSRMRSLSEIDLSSEGAVDVQILVRERRLAREPSDERLAELASLLSAAYEAHPSRDDLGVRAVERSIEAGDVARARETMTLLESLTDRARPPLPRLRLALALAEGSPARVETELAETAPDLSPASRALVATTLLDERGDEPIDQSAGITLSLAARALVSIERRESAALRPRAGRARWALRGAASALAVLAGCDAPDAIVMCGEGLADRPITRVVTPTAGTLTITGRRSCVAGAMEPAAIADLPHVIGLLGPTPDALELYVACGESLSGIAGTLDDGQLTITRAARALAEVDLPRAQRWLAEPFASLSGRVFPAPTLTLPVSGAEADRALGAAMAVEGARCERASDAIECTGALADVLSSVYASFSSD